MKFSKDEITFLKECLKWSRLSYEEKATKYFDIPGYREGAFKQTIENFKKIEEKLWNALKASRS